MEQVMHHEVRLSGECWCESAHRRAHHRAKTKSRHSEMNSRKRLIYHYFISLWITRNGYEYGAMQIADARNYFTLSFAWIILYLNLCCSSSRCLCAIFNVWMRWHTTRLRQSDIKLILEILLCISFDAFFIHKSRWHSLQWDECLSEI